MLPDSYMLKIINDTQHPLPNSLVTTAQPQLPPFLPMTVPVFTDPVLLAGEPPEDDTTTARGPPTDKDLLPLPQLRTERKAHVGLRK